MWLEDRQLSKLKLGFWFKTETFKTETRDHWIIECPELEGTYKVRVQLLAVHCTATRITHLVCLRVLSKHFLKSGGSEAMTTSLRRLFQCLATLWVKVFLISNLNVLWCFMPFPRICALVTREEISAWTSSPVAVRGQWLWWKWCRPVLKSPSLLGVTLRGWGFLN